MSDLVERLLQQASICRDSKSIGLITKRRSEVAMFEAADTITRLEAELTEARDKALDEAAEVADNAYAEHEQSGLTHPEDSDSRSRCFARARSAMYIAEAIRALKSSKPQED